MVSIVLQGMRPGLKEEWDEEAEAEAEADKG